MNTKMSKWLWVLGVMLVIVLAGCQQKTVSTTSPVQKVATQKATTPVQKATSPAIQGAAVADVANEYVDTAKAVSDGLTVEILGTKGFSPKELSVSVGDTVTWVNQDVQHKVIVLSIQNGKQLPLKTSPSIRDGEQYSLKFTQAGMYTYWTTNYGVKGTIVVN